MNFKAAQEFNRLYRPAMNKATAISKGHITDFNIENWLKNWTSPKGQSDIHLTAHKIETILYANIIWENEFLGYDGKDKVEVQIPLYVNPLLIGGELLQGYYNNDTQYISISEEIRKGFLSTHDVRKSQYVTHLDIIYVEDEANQNYYIKGNTKYLSVEGQYYRVKGFNDLNPYLKKDLKMAL